MTERNRDYLKQEFKDGERPSGTDFADLIDSFVNKTNDGLALDTDGNLQLARGVRLGNSIGTSAGTLRYNGSKVQFHNGTAWADIAGGAFQSVGDSTDVAFSGGKVGIGTFTTTTPINYRLEVQLGVNTAQSERVRFGHAVVSNGGDLYKNYACFSHELNSSDSNCALRQGPNGNVDINAPANTGGTTFQRISFLQGGEIVRMGISPKGNVVIGGNNDVGGAGDALLQVAGNTFINGNLRITGDAFKATAGAWQASDVRVKENIRNLELGLQHLLQVRPVRFRYNGKAGTPSGYEGVGIVGQEMEKIFPDMVRHVTTATPAELDSDDLLMYNDASLTYVLVNAVKELADKVQKLEAALSLANNAKAPVPDSQ